MGRVRRKRTEEEKAARRKKDLNEWRPILTVVGGSAYFIRVGRLIDPSKPAAPGNYEYANSGMTFDTDERAARVAAALNEKERKEYDKQRSRENTRKPSQRAGLCQDKADC